MADAQASAVSALPSQGPAPAAPAAPAPAAAPPIAVRPDGSISGVDGMLDQIAGALARQALPMVRDDLLPIIQNDRRMQAHIGRSIGREIAKPLWVVAIAASAYVGWKIYAGSRGARSNPGRRGGR